MYREREIDRCIYRHMCVYICIHIYIYIYVYMYTRIERERGGI